MGIFVFIMTVIILALVVAFIGTVVFYKDAYDKAMEEVNRDE